MQIEIKRWDNNKVIVCGEYESIKDCLEKNHEISFYRADLSSANLSSADLSSANLSSADLSSANLRSADLSSADLSSANLRYADLRYANLRYADLRSAYLKNIPHLNSLTINEYIKKYGIEQKGKFIFVFKGVNEDLTSPMSSEKIKYIKGVKKVQYANCDVWEQCGHGISLSPTKEQAGKWGNKVISIKVNIGDIACIPIYGNHEKFRVKKCTVLGGM